VAKAGLGVDFGSYSFRAIQGRQKGSQFAITRIVRSPVPRDSRTGTPEAGPRECVAALGEAGLRRGGAVLGLTGRDLILRYTQVPPMPDHRLRALMAFEVREVAEKAGGGVASDYRSMTFASADGGESTVVVGLAKDAFLEERFAPLAAAGITPLFGCPSSIALYNAFLRFGNFRAGETTLLLDIGAENTDLAIQRDGDLLFARNLSMGGRAFTDVVMGALGADYRKAEEIKISKANVAPAGQARFSDATAEKASRALAGPCGQLFSLAQSTVAFCRTQTKIPDLRIDRIHVSGGGSSLRGLPEYLSANFGIPVERFDPLRTVDLSGLSPEEARLAKEAPWEFAIPLGLAVTAIDPRFFRLELLPAAVKKKRHLKERTSYLVAAGVLAAAYLVTAAIVGRHNVAIAGHGVRELQQREAVLSRDGQRYEQIRREALDLADRIDKLAERTNPGMDLVRTLAVAQGLLRDSEELWIKKATFKPATVTAAARPGTSGAATKSIVKPPEILLEGAGREGGRDLNAVVNEFRTKLKAAPGVVEAHASFVPRTKEFRVSVWFEKADEPEAAGEAVSGGDRAPSGEKGGGR
jgi:type IV pilus assembly protein PilM